MFHLKKVSFHFHLFVTLNFSTIEEVSKINGKNFLGQIGTPNRNKMTKNDVLRHNSKDSHKCYYETFQQTMQRLLLWGQCWGLNPVQGITDKNPLNVRFRLDSFRFWYSAFMCFTQALFTCLFMYIIVSYPTSVLKLAIFCFHLSNLIMMLLSIRTASKWPALAQEVSSSKLGVNPRIKLKCTLALTVFVCTAFLDIIFSIIADVSYVLDCFEFDGDIYGGYIKTKFSFVFFIGMPYHIIVGIFLQFFAIASMLNWNYSDPFIICISIYLTSVLEELNKKIWLASKQGIPSSSWRDLREAYTRATRLVRLFDDAIHHVIFVSFATSLFFMCLQLFNVVSTGLKGRTNEKCPNFPSGPFNGYENSIFFLVSLMVVLLRALSVALVAAQVNTESKAALQALYEVPTKDYCNELQRFIEQIHGDTVALTGYNFFNMTRDLVLTVAGTIVTYELVLLQLKGEGLSSIANDISILKKLKINATM